MPKHAFNPDYAVHPGVTLAETLKAQGMTQSNFAIRMGLTPKTVNLIIKGKAPISYKTAHDLELVLGIPASFWNTLMLNYRVAMHAKGKRN